jgi:hypothetical protein
MTDRLSAVKSAVPNNPTTRRSLARKKYFWVKMLAYGIVLGIMFAEAVSR